VDLYEYQGKELFALILVEVHGRGRVY